MRYLENYVEDFKMTKLEKAKLRYPSASEEDLKILAERPETKFSNGVGVINLCDLYIPDRFRDVENYETETMMESITANGLLTPITVCKTEGLELIHKHKHKPVTQKYVLVAGGRRCAAWEKMYAFNKAIPARLAENVEDTVQLVQLEFLENEDRKDWSVAEKAKIIAFLKAAYDKQGKSIDELAVALNRSVRQVRRWMEASTAEAEGVVIKTGDTLEKVLSERKKLIEKKSKRALLAKEQARQEQLIASGTFEDSIPAKKLTFAIENGYCGMAIDMLRSLPDMSQDLIEIDPPYDIGLDERSSLGKDYLEAPSGDEYEPWIIDHLIEARRILKPSGSLLLWFGEKHYEMLRAALKTIFARDSISMPIVWTKTNGGTANPARVFASGYERCFYVLGKETVLYKQGSLNVIHCATEMSADRDHAAQRPSAMYYELFGRFLPPGDEYNICIPFGGSGSPISVSANLGWNTRWAELSEVNYARIIDRLNVELTMHRA